MVYNKEWFGWRSTRPELPVVIISHNFTVKSWPLVWDQTAQITYSLNQFKPISTTDLDPTVYVQSKSTTLWPKKNYSAINSKRKTQNHSCFIQTQC